MAAVTAARPEIVSAYDTQSIAFEAHRNACNETFRGRSVTVGPNGLGYWAVSGVYQKVAKLVKKYRDDIPKLQEKGLQNISEEDQSKATILINQLFLDLNNKGIKDFETLALGHHFLRSCNNVRMAMAPNQRTDFAKLLIELGSSADGQKFCKMKLGLLPIAVQVYEQTLQKSSSSSAESMPRLLQNLMEMKGRLEDHTAKTALLKSHIEAMPFDAELEVFLAANNLPTELAELGDLIDQFDRLKTFDASVDDKAYFLLLLQRRVSDEQKIDNLGLVDKTLEQVLEELKLPAELAGNPAIKDAFEPAKGKFAKVLAKCIFAEAIIKAHPEASSNPILKGAQEALPLMTSLDTIAKPAEAMDAYRKDIRSKILFSDWGNDTAVGLGSVLKRHLDHLLEKEADAGVYPLSTFVADIVKYDLVETLQTMLLSAN
ncbi:MAG: hypothetical protein KAR79_05520, partial [Simkaniaceae bacterium]|nr:hypothetical protein [Simkaniaceae bacterium]